MDCSNNKESVFRNAIDQTHEQNNAIVKGSDGAVGLTQIHQLSENGSLLGLNKHGFLCNLNVNIFLKLNLHKKPHSSLVEAKKEMGKTFLEQSEELIVLDTGNVVHESIVKTV